ncbi:MAG: hypothetical protein KFB93_03600 [Simkaniaceae bacterium]|nr:MAG: hypothetical protein KFB93_03600 [Simkaniaceae bacterium]
MNMTKLSQVAGTKLHYVMAAGVIVTDLWPHLKNGEYKVTFRKARNIGLLFFAQYLLKKGFPGLRPSGKFTVGVMCYMRLNSRDNHLAISSITAVATVALGLRSLVYKEHGVFDLIVAGGVGTVFGTFWNYALD